MDPERRKPPDKRRALRGRLGELAVDVEPLKLSRDFRLLFAGSSISRVGSELTFVAIPFQVYEITRSTVAVGLVALCELLPLFSLSIVGGHIADAMDRRALLVRADLIAAGASALLVVNATLSRPQLWPLYGLAFVHAALYALSSPAFRATAPRLLPKDKLASVAALQSVQFDLSSAFGPALGGILISVLGLELTYGLDVLTFLLSAVATRMIAPMPPLEETPGFSWHALFEGVRFLKGRPVLQGSFVVDLIAMIFGMSFSLFPAIADRFGGASILGFLYSAPAVGALLASGTSGWIRRVRRHGLAVYIAVVLWGLSLIAFALADSLWLALLTIGLAGAADSVSGIFRTAILQASTPPHLMGRLHGVEMTVVTSGPTLGDIEAGLLAGLTSVTFAIAFGGVACVIGVGVMFFVMPEFAAYQAPPSKDVEV